MQSTKGRQSMLSPVLTIASIPPADDAIDLMDIDSIKSTFDELIARKLPDDSAIEEWLADWSLLAKRISEAGTLADISFSKQTDDTDRLAAVEHYEEVVMPIVRQAEDALNRRLIETGWSRPDMERPIARIKTDMGIFRLDNVPLLGEDTLAGNRYAQMSGGLVADFDGEQRTAKKISGYLLKPDRTVRESAWRTATGLYSGIREPLDALYGEMVPVALSSPRTPTWKTIRPSAGLRWAASTTRQTMSSASIRLFSQRPYRPSSVEWKPVGKSSA